MNILWLSWKDRQHPQAGGAETVSGEIMNRLVRDGHQVRLITAQYPGSLPKSEYEGITTYHQGNRYTLYWLAYRRFQQMSDWPDLIIDEMNTLPFGVAFYSKRKCVLLTYQLARRVWFYQIYFPISLLGYLVEPFYVRLLTKRYKLVLTESNSTKKDLERYGFSTAPIGLIRVGTSTPPLSALQPKQNFQTLLFLGALRPMKRPIDAIKAFEVARDYDPTLYLIMAGNDTSAYAKKVRAHTVHSRHHEAISIIGKVSEQERLQLLRRAAVILVTSVKEGWGLVVTEANTQGTPAIAYNTDGLRDSIRHRESGILVPPGDFKAMGKATNELMANQTLYTQIRNNAWHWSKGFTFDNSYRDFCSYLQIPRVRKP